MKTNRSAARAIILTACLLTLLVACQPELKPVPTDPRAVPPLEPTKLVTLVTALPPFATPTAEAPTTMPTSSDDALQSLFPPSPADTSLGQGKFFVDVAQLLPYPDQPGATALMLQGSLPTPCNQLRVQLSAPDAKNRIRIHVYSVIDKNKICTQVLEPFEGKVASISGLPTGTYPVLVNDEVIGTIQVP